VASLEKGGQEVIRHGMKASSETVLFDEGWGLRDERQQAPSILEAVPLIETG
jgi:hypothetical protein